MRAEGGTEKPTMTQVALVDAQKNLLHLIALVQKGEEVIILEEGTPVVRLMLPASQAPKRRIPGIEIGVFTVPEDFDDPLPDELLKSFGV